MLGKDGDMVGELRTFLLEMLAANSGPSLVSYLDDMIGNITLSSIGWSSFAAVLITLILLLSQIEGALNRVWLVRKARNMFTRFMYFWTFMTLGLVAMGLIVGVSGFRISRILSATAEAQESSFLLSSLLTMAAGFVFFFLLYKLVPNTKVKTRHAAIGAVVASFLLQQAGRVYGIYVSDFTNYQSLYGVLAALPIFLMWMYICWIIILLGAVISWRMQQGFPKADEEDTLDAAKQPKDRLRNVQVRAAMPTIALLAIHRKFSEAEGKGLFAEDLAEELKLPLMWVKDAMDALESMGYVVRAQTQEGAQDAGPIMMESYFPAYPATSIQMRKFFADMDSPLAEWLENWRHDMQIDFSQVITEWSGPKRDRYSDFDLEQAMERLRAEAQH